MLGVVCVGVRLFVFWCCNCYWWGGVGVVLFFVCVECLVDVFVQFIVVLWFGQEVVDCVVVDCVGDGVEVGVVGQYQVDCVWVEYFYLVQEFGVVYVVYVLVGQDYLYVVDCQQVEGIVYVVGCQNLIVVVVEQVYQ